MKKIGLMWRYLRNNDVISIIDKILSCIFIQVRTIS